MVIAKNGILRTKTGRAVTFVVAASNSEHKEEADYICDGVSDNVEIQEALDGLPGSGGAVQLLAGTYNTQAKIVLDEKIRLVGEGMFSTIFNYTGGDYAIELFRSGSYAKDIELADFKITFGADAVGGIHCNSAKRCNIYNVYIDGSNNVDVGIDIDGGSDGSWYNVFTNIVITNITNVAGTGKGVYAHAGVSPTNNLCIIGGLTLSNDYNFYIEGNGHNFHGVNIEKGITRDIYCNGRADFYGCRLENTGFGSVECTAGGKLGIYGGRFTGAYITGSIWSIFQTNGSGVSRSSSLGITRLLNHIYFASNFDSLQDCVDVAPDGSTIMLDSGTYSGISLDGRRNLHFVGVGDESTIIAGVAVSGVVLTNHCRYNTFENLQITSTGTYAVWQGGYPINTVFRNCVLNSTGGHAVYFNMSGLREGHKIINCHITGAGDNGIYCHASTTAGGVGLLVDSCIIEGTTGAGIVFSRAHDCIVKSTIIKEPTAGDTDAITIGSNSDHIRVFGCDLTPRGIGVPVSDAGANNTIESARHSDLFMDVLAVSATHIRTNEDLSAATPIAFTLDAQPDIPRTLSAHFDSHAQITEYDIEIIGIDAKGNVVTETKDEADGWDWETNNAFATVTSIKMTARTGTGAGDTMDIGITDVLGLSNVFNDTGDVFKIKKNNANSAVAGAQVNKTYHTYDMSVIGLAATDDFTIWYKSNLNVIG